MLKIRMSIALELKFIAINTDFDNFYINHVNIEQANDNQKVLFVEI